MWFADIYCDIGWVAGQNGHLGARRMRLSGTRLGRRGAGARQHGDGHPPLPHVHPEPHSAGRVRPGHPDSADRAAVAARPRLPPSIYAPRPRGGRQPETMSIDAMRRLPFGYRTDDQGATACAVTPYDYWSGRPESNRRRPAWEAGILPLNYARICVDSRLARQALSN